MNQQCEMLENCPFFKNYQGSYQVIKEGWIALYCFDLKKSELCQRKIYRKSKGTPPPDNLAPTGRMI